MKLHEEKLKKIIEEIEKYAVINSIEILNSEIFTKIPKINKVLGFDLNLPLQFSIKFTLGELREQRKWETVVENAIKLSRRWVAKEWLESFAVIAAVQNITQELIS